MRATDGVDLTAQNAQKTEQPLNSLLVVYGHQHLALYLAQLPLASSSADPCMSWETSTLFACLLVPS
jgi:steroid 5-alpha reductase family enzyme